MILVLLFQATIALAETDFIKYQEEKKEQFHKRVDCRIRAMEKLRGSKLCKDIPKICEQVSDSGCEAMFPAPPIPPECLGLIW